MCPKTTASDNLMGLFTAVLSPPHCHMVPHLGFIELGVGLLMYQDVNLLCSNARVGT
jgi:hypothetical protein